MTGKTMNKHTNRHNSSRQTGLVCASALSLALALVLTTAGPATAQTPNNPLILPAGQACEGFDLSFSTTGGNQVHKEFTDKNGLVIRKLSAGKGAVLTFGNVQSGVFLTIKTGGSVTHETIDRNGTSTFVGTGHNGFIFFPTDNPKGPATVIFLGRVVYSTTADGVTTLTQTGGKQIDICAALS
jgi:hypothetical protein